jgi:hypothetical protein
MRLAILAWLALVSSCTAAHDERPASTTTQEAAVSTVVAARITQRSETARVLELVDAAGNIVGAYYPGFFNATQIVPDPDTGMESMTRVQGSWFHGAALDAASGRVAVAVRGFVFAETSFDLVYVIDTRSTAFLADPYANAAFTYLPFDGRRADGVLPSSTTPTRPWLDIIPEGIRFDDGGRLSVEIADAAGSTAEFAYAEDLTADTCTWRFSFASARCPDPSR